MIEMSYQITTNVFQLVSTDIQITSNYESYMNGFINDTLCNKRLFVISPINNIASSINA